MDKLDKYIKEQMVGRELSPSPQAWGKLENRLKHTEMKRNRAKIITFSAACIAVIFVISSVVLYDISSPPGQKETDTGFATQKSDSPTLRESIVGETSESAELEGNLVATRTSPEKEQHEEIPNEQEKEGKEKAVSSLPQHPVAAIRLPIKADMLQSPEMAAYEADKYLREALLKVRTQQILYTKEDHHINAQALLKEAENNPRSSSFPKRVYGLLEDGVRHLATSVVDKN